MEFQYLCLENPNDIKVFLGITWVVKITLVLEPKKAACKAYIRASSLLVIYSLAQCPL